jgi:hypothetical protein
MLVIYNSASFPVFLLKNRTEPKPIGLNRFRFEFFSFSKFYFGYFLDKNRTEPKMLTPS